MRRYRGASPDERLASPPRALASPSPDGDRRWSTSGTNPLPSGAWHERALPSGHQGGAERAEADGSGAWAGYAVRSSYEAAPIGEHPWLHDDSQHHDWLRGSANRSPPPLAASDPERELASMLRLLETPGDRGHRRGL